MAKVEPFVAHANELLAAPANPEAKAATVADLKDMISAAEAVGAPKPKQNNISSFIPELMECINNMQEIEPATPEGQKVSMCLFFTFHVHSLRRVHLFRRRRVCSTRSTVSAAPTK